MIGTSGLTEEDYTELGMEAERQKRAVLAVGTFALTAVLLQKFAETAARLIPQWEIIDYAHDDKRDAPSGTARELAARLSNIRPSELTVPLEEVQGAAGTRGARLNGSQVHPIRLPGYTLSVEIIFGQKDQRLSIRHDSGSSAEPNVGGGLLAIRKVGSLVGLHRGLESVLELEGVILLASIAISLKANMPEDGECQMSKLKVQMKSKIRITQRETLYIIVIGQ